MQRLYFRKQAGFTLIEMIVSLGVFSIVVTTAVGAILVMISSNQRLQAEQNVMTNLSFALDTMTREMRTGYNYVCDSAVNLNTGVTGLTPNLTGQPPQIFDDSVAEHENLGPRTKDCINGRSPATSLYQGVSFYEGGNSLTGTAGNRRILYYYDVTEKTIMRRVGNGSAQSIVSSGLYIADAQFYVSGSEPLSAGGTNYDQPSITVYIAAREKNDATTKTYHLQTSVTQRILDI